MSSNVIETIEQIALPIVEEQGLTLVDVEYVKEGRNWFLRIYIDKENGIDIADCGLISEKLSERLDELDPIPEAYFLEVSSPGIERPLKTKEDILKNIGQLVFIKLYEPLDGTKEYEGLLIDFAENILTVEYKIKTRKKQIEISYDKIAKARLAVSF